MYKMISYCVVSVGSGAEQLSKVRNYFHDLASGHLGRQGNAKNGRTSPKSFNYSIVIFHPVSPHFVG